MIKATQSREFSGNLQITTSEIKTRCTQDMSRRLRFLERARILRDDLRGVVDSKLSLMFDWESYSDMRNYIDVSNNLMRRVVREISTLYKDEHERTVTPEAGQKVYEKDIENMKLNSKFSRYQQLLNGLNDLIVKVEGAAGEVDLTVFTPDQVTVFENPHNSTMLDAIIIEDNYRNQYNSMYTIYGDTQPGPMRRRWIFWSPTRHFILDDEFKMRAVPDNPDMLNPYWERNMQEQAFYPFIGLHNGERENYFWDVNTGSDLVEATKIIAIKNTFLYFMFPMQFKQLAAEGTFDDKSEFKNRQIKSPLHVMKSNQKLTVLDWQSSLSELDDRIQAQLFQVASNYGISAENFKLTASQTSGFARMIAKERLLEIRQEQVPVWRQVEVETFDGVRAARDIYDLGEMISPDADFSIDYKDPKMLQDPLVELELDEKEIEMGLTNILQLIKERNPDIKTDAEAEAILAKNIETRNRLKSRFGLVPINVGQGISPAQTPAATGERQQQPTQPVKTFAAK